MAVDGDPDRGTGSHRCLSDPAASSWKNRGQYYGRTCGSIFVLCPLFCCACPDRFYGHGKRESSDCFRTEDHTCTSKQPDGEVCQPQCRHDQPAGTGNDGITVRWGCGYGREPVYFRNYQYVRGCLQDPEYPGGDLVPE